jgi:hypothetical protein
MGNTKKISDEEKWMIEYFQELMSKDYIKKIIHQPEPIQLSDTVIYPFRKTFKTKEDEIEDKTLLRGHIYTPDFKIVWSDKKTKLTETIEHLYSGFFSGKLPPFLCDTDIGRPGKYVSYIEVKGGFDRSNMTRLFTTRTQPWILQQHEIYINLIKVPDIFKKTFIPRSILPEFYYKKKTKKNKVGDKKYNWEYKMLEDYE